MAKEISSSIKKQFAQFLNNKFIEWESTRNKRGTISEFSQYLNINEKYVAKWMSGTTTPRDDNVIKLANRLGGEIYDILEWERPKEMPPNATSDTASLTSTIDLDSPNTTTTKRKQKINSAPDNAINLLTGGGVKSTNVAMWQGIERRKKVNE